MGLHKQSAAAGGGAYLKLVPGEVVEVALDTRLDATEDASHDTQPPRPCSGAACPLCAAGVKRRVRWKVNCRVREAGAWSQKIWGVSPSLLRAIGAVTPPDSKARIEVVRSGEGLATTYRLKYLSSEITHTGIREATTERDEDRPADPHTDPAPAGDDAWG